MICAQSSEQTGITVISDDTDVFVPLLHNCHKVDIKNCITMKSPIKDRATINISKTVEKHADIIGEILPVHARTGCDTVVCCYGMGKGTALKLLKAGVHSLVLLGQVDAPIDSVIHQASAFMSACYGCSSSKSMSETRFRLWHLKPGVHHHQLRQNCAVLLQQIRHLRRM
jgi:5'-3' exonuclease